MRCQRRAGGVSDRRGRWVVATTAPSHATDAAKLTSPRLAGRGMKDCRDRGHHSTVGDRHYGADDGHGYDYWLGGQDYFAAYRAAALAVSVGLVGRCASGGGAKSLSSEQTWRNSECPLTAGGCARGSRCGRCSRLYTSRCSIPLASVNPETYSNGTASKPRQAICLRWRL